MASRRVKSDEAREHERRAWELRQQGWTQERIAAELKITHQAVSAILARICDRVLAELKDKVERKKAEQEAQLAWIMDEALQAWAKSKRKRGAIGDLACLDEARAALADLRKLWGLDAPTKIAPTTPDGDEPYESLTEQERVAGIIGILRRAGVPVPALPGGDSPAGGQAGDAP